MPPVLVCIPRENRVFAFDLEETARWAEQRGALDPKQWAEDEMLRLLEEARNIDPDQAVVVPPVNVTWWVAGRCQDNDSAWAFRGVFDSAERAAQNCTGDGDFYAPAGLNRLLPEGPGLPDGAIFPSRASAYLTSYLRSF